MAVEVELTQGDTGPPIEATLSYKDGSHPDLTGASAEFHMIDQEGNLKVDNAATVQEAENKVRYEWQTGDTEKAGRFRGEFEVTLSSGEVQTWPSDGQFYIVIREQYG